MVLVVFVLVFIFILLVIYFYLQYFNIFWQVGGGVFLVIAKGGLGNSKSKTSNIFNINRKTLNSWINLNNQGKLFEIKEYHHSFESKINLDELKKYVDENSDKILP